MTAIVTMVHGIVCLCIGMAGPGLGLIGAGIRLLANYDEHNKEGDVK